MRRAATVLVMFLVVFGVLLAVGTWAGPSLLFEDVGARAVGVTDGTLLGARSVEVELAAGEPVPYDDLPVVLPYRDPAERWRPDPSMLPVGTDWATVVQQVLDIRAEAYRRADVRPLGDVLGGRCGCLHRDMEAIKDLARRGLRFDGAAPQVLDVELRQRAAWDAVVVRATVRQDPYEMRWLDTDEVAWVGPGRERRVLDVALFLNGSFGTVDHGDDRWTVVGLQWFGRGSHAPDHLE